MSQWKFSIRDGNLEARSCNHMLLQDGEHTKVEIIVWGQEKPEKKEHNYVIAVFDPDYEEFSPDLRFIGDRPLQEGIDWIAFGELARESYRLFSRFLGQCHSLESD